MGNSCHLPWVPEGFFFRSEAAIVGGEAAKKILWHPGYLPPRTRGGDRGRYYLLHEEERIFPKYILGLVSVATVISSYLEFKGYSAVPVWTVWTQISNGVDRLDPIKHHTYKDHVYIDRLFLLSNLTWRRAHVTAGLTGRDPNVTVNVLRRFHWGQKVWL